MGDHEPVVLHVDALSSNGINPGTPHYALWSPDGERVALITDAGQGIVAFNLDAETGLNIRGFYDGAPVYISWSADSEHMLVHLSETLYLWSRDPETGKSTNEKIGFGSISYKAPQWNPVSDTYLYVDVVDGERRLLVGSLGELEPTLVRVLDDAAEFTWSPDGNRIALFTGHGEFFDRIEVLGPDGETAGPEIEGPILAAWWSPDGQKLLVAMGDAETEGIVVWSVVDLSSGQVEEAARSIPSGHLYLMLTFHSQYAASHQLWSPDSQRFVVVGALLGDDGDVGREFTASGTEISRVWIVDSSGDSPPAPVGDGLFAAWSPT